ncbi:MAG: hypothetical protein GEU90_19875 [Gemmatimonas sp.]|nr:hypothetical protein [Gemmatimonas sp.]
MRRIEDLNIRMTGSQLTPTQRGLLLELPEQFGVVNIDRIWIFSARPGKTRETGLFVISLLPSNEHVASHRTLFTLRYRVESINGKLQRIADRTEEGRAPPERIDRIIAGVLSRAGDDAGDPMEAVIEGDLDRWQALLAALEGR